MVKKTAILFPTRDAVSFDFFLDSYVFSSRFVRIFLVSPTLVMTICFCLFRASRYDFAYS